MNTENFINLTRGVNILELVGTLPVNSLALEQRLLFAQQTIRNTCVKLGHLRRPEQLLWAMHNGGTYHAIGFAREVLDRQRAGVAYADITADVRRGARVLSEDDYVRFAITYPGSSTLGQGYVQLRYLKNDPMAIARMTRGLLVAHENQERELDAHMAARELKQLEKEQQTQASVMQAKVEAVERRLDASYVRVGRKARVLGTGKPELGSAG